MNQARIKQDNFRFCIMGQESKSMTIKIPVQERIKIFSDPPLDGKRESRNEIQDFKRRNIKNIEKITQRNTNRTASHKSSF